MKQFHKLLKYVSDTNELLGSPYFVNIGLPTNYRYSSEVESVSIIEGSLDGYNYKKETIEFPRDITYASLSVGMYIPKWDPETWGKQEILEEKIFFGPVHMIVNGKALAHFLWNIDSANEATHQDLVDNIERLRTEIHGYLLHKCKVN